MRVRTIVIAVALAAAVGSPAPAADWPHFRGPDNDGTSSETGLLESWPEGGPNVLWKKDLGGGFSGISVSDGQLYTMFDLKQETFVASFDAATGEQVWRFGAGKAWKDRQGDGPRSTPTVDGDTVYAVTATGMLYALSSDEGIVRWERNLKDEYGAKIPQWGMSTSPVVAGGFLLLEVGGTDALMVALNKKNGREVWRATGWRSGEGQSSGLLWFEGPNDHGP